MMKTVTAASLCLALSALGVAAQNSPQIPAQSVPQGLPQSGSAPAGATQPAQNAHGSPSPGGQSVSASSYLSRQEANQFMGVSIVQQPVYMADGRGIGEVDDLLIDRDGRIAAVVIDVGGFLGTTGRRIAVPMTALDLQKPTTAGAEPTSLKVVLRADRAQIEQAPAFESNLGPAQGRTQRSR